MKHIKKFNENFVNNESMLKMMSDMILSVLFPILERLPEEAKRKGMTTSEYFKMQGLDSRIDNLRELYNKAKNNEKLKDTCQEIQRLLNLVDDLKSN